MLLYKYNKGDKKMTKKKIEKLAKEILRLEKILQSENSSQEEKKNTEKKITNLAYAVFKLPNGFTIMSEIDEFIQKNI